MVEVLEILHYLVMSLMSKHCPYRLKKNCVFIKPDPKTEQFEEMIKIHCL